MKIWKLLMLTCAAAVGSALTACQELDIPPKSIITNESIFNEAGIAAYMAGMYNHLPMEDFNMGDRGDQGGFFNWNNQKSTLGTTGEFANNICGNDPVYGDKGYWKDAFQIIRQANVLIQDLPAYIGKLNGVEGWIAEAKFIRAYTYFALVKRYGGMPILKEPQSISADGGASLNVARSSHQESVDFILEDLDYAMTYMGKDKVSGRANLYVAAALKSRVALYAGSVARYGSTYNHFSTSGIQLTGIPAEFANGYFQQAFDAALAVDEGGYALVVNSDKRKAFYEVFDNAVGSIESIFIREYDVTNYVHSWDKIMSPKRLVGNDYGSCYFVPLDWVELFDGLPKDPATGFLKTTDDDGNYVVYNSHAEFWANAEPRLKASIMIPGETYKAMELDMRVGLITEDVNPAADKIKKVTLDDGKTTYSWDDGPKQFQVSGKVVAVRSTAKPSEGQSREVSGKKIAICGFDGPSTSADNVCNTGIYGVKWLNRTSTSGETALHRSTQPWIDIRYAEVLLNRAEAAVELAQNGVTSYRDKVMLTDAFECINKVRDRAGATLLASESELADVTVPTNGIGLGINSWIYAPTVGLKVVRVERYKELAVEHKLYWDIRRWFTADQQMYQMRWRMLAPYLFASTAVRNEDTGIPHGQYIYDTRVCDSYGGQHKFEVRYYYEKIPDTERKVNYLLEQNGGY